jgi:hypothetical protein
MANKTSSKVKVSSSLLLKFLSLMVLTACLAWNCFGHPFTAQTQNTATKKVDAPSTTPPQGSPERKAILDAVRRRLKIQSQFKVDYLKVNGNWCFFNGGEVVMAERELQETDLSVAALLERKTVAGKTSWVVSEMWTLPTDQEQPRDKFVARVRQKQKTANIPKEIFPDDLEIR